MTMNVRKYCNHLLIKLTKILMLKKFIFLLKRREESDSYYVKTKYTMHRLIFILFMSVTATNMFRAEIKPL
jgi:hypothetical protein